jgi:hypothetical protein
MIGTRFGGSGGTQADGWLALSGLALVVGIIAAIAWAGQYVGYGLNWAINNALTFMTTISDQTGLVPITDEESWRQNGLSMHIVGSVLIAAAIVALIIGIAYVFRRVRVESAIHGWSDDEGRE